MKLKNIYIVTGIGKDADGKHRKRVTEVMALHGAKEVNTPEQADVIVVLGGDGTIMRASHTAQRLNIPIIGINLGRIGYMAELETDETDRFGEALEGNYTEERRMLLTVEYKGETYHALNDAVVRAQTIHPAFVTLECDGNIVNTYRGDGLICSTPTGSTAYSVSAGGSVIDPRLDCICITPLCAQSLVARPLIFSPECVLNMRAEEGYKCILTVDGEEGIPLDAGENVTIKRSERPLRMLKLSDDEFYTVLNRKLYV